MTFEEKLDKLKILVDQLEKSNSGLEESIKLYEEARLLSEELTHELDEASKKIVLIMNEDKTVPFEEIEE